MAKRKKSIQTKRLILDVTGIDVVFNVKQMMLYGVECTNLKRIGVIEKTLSSE